LIGIFTIFFKEKSVEKALFVMIALSAGTLLGAAFLDLIPESIDVNGVETTMQVVLVGFLLFFILEKLVIFHHCHSYPNCKHEERKHALPYLNLIGDGVHNFVDGMVIAAAYFTDPSLGVITTIAIIAHEMPQEIGDFGVLLYCGMNKINALAFNFLTALTSMVGALFVIILNIGHESIISLLVPLAAGHFIYIAAADIIPELQKSTDKKRAVFELIIMVAGILFLHTMGIIFGNA
jgi:zinc and cadmium transporter